LPDDFARILAPFRAIYLKLTLQPLNAKFVPLCATKTLMIGLALILRRLFVSAFASIASDF
jgi:hypothetical protein